MNWVFDDLLNEYCKPESVKLRHVVTEAWNAAQYLASYCLWGRRVNMMHQFVVWQRKILNVQLLNQCIKFVERLQSQYYQKESSHVSPYYIKMSLGNWENIVSYLDFGCFNWKAIVNRARVSPVIDDAIMKVCIHSSSWRFTLTWYYLSCDELSVSTFLSNGYT